MFAAAMPTHTVYTHTHVVHTDTHTHSLIHNRIAPLLVSKGTATFGMKAFYAVTGSSAVLID